MDKAGRLTDSGAMNVGRIDERSGDVASQIMSYSRDEADLNIKEMKIEIEEKELSRKRDNEARQRAPVKRW